MSKIDRTSKRPITKSDFKANAAKNSPVQKTHVFSESSKARQWDSSTTDQLTGLFNIQEGTPATSTDDNSFGEFQSVAAMVSSQANTQQMLHVTHMATPTTGSPQLVHSQQGHTPLMATGAPFNNNTLVPYWLTSGAMLPNVYLTVYQVKILMSL